MKRILVLCTGNSCRSQIAHAYLAHFAQHLDVEVFSAGIEKHGVNPKAIAVLKEDGIDISTYTSNLIDEYLHLQFDYLITVCDHANETCPVFPSSAVKIHHNFSDPSKVEGTATQQKAAFEKSREEIKSFCKEFVLTEIA